jgi:D-sedoheptulose 7-phosphate isomerase
MDLVTEHFRSSAQVKLGLAETSAELIVLAAKRMAEALQAGRKILLCGNGGSAADCQHVAAELVNSLSKEFQRPALAAIALTTDSSILSSYANDHTFDGVFARQVEALGMSGDVLIAISTSGNSENIIRAVLAGQRKQMVSIGLLGRGGGKLKDLVDIAIIVPSDSTHHIQESHIAIEHILCDLVEHFLFNKYPSVSR